MAIGGVAPVRRQVRGDVGLTVHDRYRIGEVDGLPPGGGLVGEVSRSPARHRGGVERPHVGAGVARRPCRTGCR